MALLTIILGLIGLGIVITIHELGHYFAARRMNVEVEAFSIGWGPALFSWKIKNTQWRLGVLPIGGYCKMKGEEAFKRALGNPEQPVALEPGSFYSASPLRRIVISLAGPAANLLFALIIGTAIAFVGLSQLTGPNKIIVQAELDKEVAALAPGSSQPASTEPSAAEIAGLKTGDRIVEINGKRITDFKDIMDSVIPLADKSAVIKVERGGSLVVLQATPKLNKKSGAGMLGITYWMDPVIDSVKSGSQASIANLAPGDRIVSIVAQDQKIFPVTNVREFYTILDAIKPEEVNLGVLRNGNNIEVPFILNWSSSSDALDLGIGFKMVAHTTAPASNLPQAIGQSAGDTWQIVTSTIGGFGMMFQGIDILGAVAGPARLTWMIGESVTEGVQDSTGNGLLIPLNFLMFLSVVLFIMNLLPIPVLDGGQIVLFVIEMIRRRPFKVKSIYRYQLIGMTMAFSILVLATVSDFFFFTGR